MKVWVALALVGATLGCTTVRFNERGAHPRTGKFEGTFRHDRFGVVRLGHFRVDDGVARLLALNEGRRLSFEVTEAEAVAGPELGLVHAVRAVEPVFSDEAWRLEWTFRPARPQAGEPFQAVGVLVHGSGAEERMCPHRVSVALADARGRVLGVDVGTAVDQDGRALAGIDGRLPAVERDGRRPFVVQFDRGLPEGLYELEATLLLGDDDACDHGHATGDRGAPWDRTKLGCGRRIQVWAPLDVIAMGERAALPLAPEARLVRSEDGDEYIATLVVPHAAGRVLFTDAHGACVARVRAETADGTAVALLRTDRKTAADQLWIPAPVPETGRPIGVAFRKTTAFSRQAIAAVFLDVLTGAGLETFVVADGFREELPPVPDWGPPSTDGVRLRIRPAQAPLALGEALRFNVEAAAEDEYRVSVGVSHRGLGRRVEVWLDGVRLRLPASDQESLRRPAEWVLELPPSLVRVATGAHTLRYVLTPHWGYATEASRYRLPGRVECEVTFEVR